MNAYTYLIGWSELGKFYYGCQYGKSADPKNLWRTYFTSSKHVRAFRREHGDPDIVEVRKNFGENGDACREWEERVLTRVVRRRDGLWLNRRATSGKWFHRPGHGAGVKKTPEHARKIGDANRGYVNAVDMRSGERVRVTKAVFHSMDHFVGAATGTKRTPEHVARMIEVNTGKTLSEEHRRKLSVAGMGRKRDAPLSEEHRIKISKKLKNRVLALNTTTGEKIYVSKDEFDARGDLVGHTSGKGKPHEAETKKKIGESQRGMFTALDISTGEFRKVSREEFSSNPNLKGTRYKGHLPSMARL